MSTKYAIVVSCAEMHVEGPPDPAPWYPTTCLGCGEAIATEHQNSSHLPLPLCLSVIVSATLNPTDLSAFATALPSRSSSTD
jgi:hypothetical protein